MMNRYKITAIILFTALILTACNNDDGAAFRIAATLSSEEFAVAFREGDRQKEAVDAALKVLAWEGEIARLSQKWFGEDLSIIKGESGALDGVETSSQRMLIVGVQDGTPPMCYKDEYGEFRGFDIELAAMVCNKLGWDFMFLPIGQDKVKVELRSGNIDCAWGSGITDSELSVTVSYMKNEKVIVARADSNVRSKNGLRGRDLGLTYAPSSMSALKADEKLMTSLRSYIRYQSVDQCFEALRNGDCDAVLVDSVSANYYTYKR